MGEKRITANSLCMIRRWFTLSTSCFTSRLVDMLLSNLGNLTMFVFSLAYSQASARKRCPATWWAFLFVNFRPSNLGLFGFSLQAQKEVLPHVGHFRLLIFSRAILIFSK